ncbi:LuxR C-terminal-related transcriptional regulator [Streptosporangium sp. NPDC000396]|uniref:LuxR C-terminal-related transcriptional regulator n=1 Tax=Streptosporangium sp. NPDC000396 TaxID=3366185 RepID=UPI0036AE6C05
MDGAPQEPLSSGTGRGLPPPLTKTELAVLLLISDGHRVPEIAVLLGISRRAVESHKRHLYRKLDVGTQSHAVSRAISLGLLNPPRGDLRPAPEPGRPGLEPGRPELVIVHARQEPWLEHLAKSLLTRGTPFVLTPTLEVTSDHWARWHRGPLTAVLVDPLPHDWRLAARLHARVIVIRSTPPDFAEVTYALRRGAHALLWGDDMHQDLVPVLTLVTRGYFTMSSTHIGPIPRARPDEHPGPLTHLPELTRRERDILSSIASGHTIRQTARVLGIAAKTVENTQARLFRKLGTRNRSETLTIAYRLGVVERPMP